MTDDDFKRIAAQRNALKGYEMPFEQWHQAMHTPQPDEHFGISKATAELLVSTVPNDKMVTLVEKIAAGNDVDSLQHFMDDRLVRRLQPQGPLMSPEIAFAVTHMLVNGRGQEQFAAQWLQTFSGKLGTYAHRYYRGGLQQADTAKDEIVFAQRRLGLAGFCDPFGRPDGSTSPAIIAVLEREIPLEEPLRTRIRTQRQYELACILKDHLPSGEFPLYTTQLKGKAAQSSQAIFGTEVSKSTLADKLWAPELIYATEAVRLAYGIEHELVRKQMHEGIKTAMAAARFQLDDKGLGKDQWDALAIWGDKNIANALWRSQFKTNVQGTVMGTIFHEELLRIPQDQAIATLNRLDTMGADPEQWLEHNLGYTQSNRKQFRGFRRLMDYAVDQAAPHIVGWLLVNECDPEREMNEDGVWLQGTAVERAYQKEEQSKGGAKHDQIVQIAGMMRAHMAKKEAMHALGLIEDIAEEEKKTGGMRP